jgi:hypothetical protein
MPHRARDTIYRCSTPRAGDGSTIFSFNLSIDTRGLSGKDIHIGVPLLPHHDLFGANIALDASVFINSSSVQPCSSKPLRWVHLEQRRRPMTNEQYSAPIPER